MRGGDFDTLVSIRERDTTQATDGEVVNTYTEIVDGECWANILFSNGRETIQAGKETSVAQCSIRVRYRTDVTAAMRVYDGTDAYEIKAVMPDKVRRQYVDLVCELVSGD